MHIKYYSLGDKYMIPNLRHDAGNAFSNAQRQYWDSRRILEVLEKALAVTQDSDKGLRPALARSIALRLALLVTEEELKSILFREPAFQFLVLETVANTAATSM